MPENVFVVKILIHDSHCPKKKKTRKQYKCKIKKHIKNSNIQKYYVNQTHKNIQFYNLFL